MEGAGLPYKSVKRRWELPLSKQNHIASDGTRDLSRRDLVPRTPKTHKREPYHSHISNYSYGNWWSSDLFRPLDGSSVDRRIGESAPLPSLEKPDPNVKKCQGAQKKNLASSPVYRGSLVNCHGVPPNWWPKLDKKTSRGFWMIFHGNLWITRI